MEDPTELPDTYAHHPVTQARGGKSSPVGFFSDGVPFTKSDGFTAMYWSNLITGKRTLICVVRKSDLCQCGCRGQCTMGGIFRILVWSFNVLATGQYPTHRHDGGRLDARRRQLQGDLAQ
eukprot:8175677-Alexandrium_andersonii.AAC.1